MASLSSLLQTKQALAQIDEENLDQGQIWVYSPGSHFTNFRCNFCWLSPGNGTAVIEIWGASGSAARVCCCGFGVGGNPGAYAKKTVNVLTGSRISGNVGVSCGNADALNFRGCSCWTGVCICAGETLCMCAEGGRGGTSYQNDGSSIYCCFIANGFCGTSTGTGCGVICNVGSGFFIPSAYNGDINCQGQFSCIVFGHCNASCWCLHTQYVKTSANIFGQCPSTISATHDSDYSRGGFAVGSFFQNLAGTSASPVYGGHYRYCWANTNYCGCYEAQGCQISLPPGIPAPGSTPCSSVRDHGLRGGHGSIKIRFIPST
jgi:hypothetical protein